VAKYKTVFHSHLSWCSC